MSQSHPSFLSSSMERGSEPAPWTVPGEKTFVPSLVALPFDILCPRKRPSSAVHLTKILSPDTSAVSPPSTWCLLTFFLAFIGNPLDLLTPGILAYLSMGKISIRYPLCIGSSHISFHFFADISAIVDHSPHYLLPQLGSLEENADYPDPPFFLATWARI